VSAGKVEVLHARIVLGLLYPRQLQMIYHAAGGGCRNRACQVRSWSPEEAGWTGPGKQAGGGGLGRLHIRVHLWWESRWSRRLLVVTGARCPLTKPVVTAVELRVDHRAPLQPRRAARPAVFAHMWHVVHREPTPRRPGVRMAPGPQALPMPAANITYFTRSSTAEQGGRRERRWRRDADEGDEAPPLLFFRP
jgi:hypothetical protein